MIQKDITKKNLNLIYSVIVDGESKSKKQNVSNIKLDAADDKLFSTGTKIGTLINAPAIDIEEVNFNLLTES